MAKRAAYLHIGLPHSGGERIGAALQEHAEALSSRGVLVASSSVDEMFRAAVELRREHKAWGLRRKDVEGVWSGVCRRAAKGRGALLLGHPLLAGSTEAEIDLLVDRLPGFAVHLVVSVAAPDARLAAFPDDHDLGEVLRRWDRVVCSPDRMLVVVCDRADPTAAWHEIGRVVGFEAGDLDLPTTRVDHVDTGALRLLAESTGSLAHAEDLVAVVEEWAKLVADRGYDVRGDLSGLAAAVGAVPEGTSGPADLGVAALGEALSDTLAEVARLRARSRDLERDNASLTRKKRKLKDRLAKL